jgi:LPS sulfotransferase NodH
MANYRSYILCASPRTGSTLLCDLLASTGVAGRPDSFFRRQSVSWWAAHLGVPDPSASAQPDAHRRFLKAVLAEGRGSTGIFGLRLMQETVADLSARLGPLYPDLQGDAARFDRAFGPTLYIHLSRPDKVAQAISFARAVQSGLWHRAPDGTEIERLSPPETPKYDAKLLRRLVGDFEAFDAAWTLCFARQGIAPLHVSYDDLSAGPSLVLAEILERLGLDPALASGVTPGVARLADDVSLDWHRRYRADWHGPNPT